MSEFATRAEYIAKHLGDIDEEYGIHDYGLLNHGRGAHLIQPKENAGHALSTLRDAIRLAGGVTQVNEEGGLIPTNTWEREDEFVLRVELDDAYEAQFRLLDRLRALPYFDQEGVYLREPPEKGLVAFELVIEYDPSTDDRFEEVETGVLDQEVWSLIDSFTVEEVAVDDGVTTFTLQPTDERFHPGTDV